MSFLQPLLLWGTLLGSIPIIIHLLSRRRYKVIRWAAVDFLLRALSERSRNVRIQDLILLALRTLALIVAALALARPVLAPSAVGALGGSTDVVFVMDTSYSMGAGTAETQFDVMKRRAQEMLAALPEQARVGVVTMTRDAERLTEGLTEEHRRVEGLLGGLELSSRGTRALPAMTEAFAMLAESSASSKRIFLFTDAQAEAFASQEDELRQLIEAADPSIGFLVMTSPPVAETNLAVTEISLESRRLRVGSAADITAWVRSWNAPNAETEAELWVDRRKVDSESVTLRDGEAVVRFRHTFTSAGLFPVEVRLAADGLDTDNHRYLAVHVPTSMDVLVVGGQDRGEDGPGAFVFLEAALSSNADDTTSAPPFAVRSRISGDRLADSLDEDVWTVVLADAGALPSDALRALSAHVHRGGSVLISSGPDAVTSLGPLRSGQDGAGEWLETVEFSLPEDSDAREPLSLQLADAVAESAGRERIVELDSPGVREALSSVRFFEHLEMARDGNDAWIDVLTLTNGQPLLAVMNPSHTSAARGSTSATQPVGTSRQAQGRLAWLTTTLDPRWSDLVLRPAFVPLLHDVLIWLNRPHLVASSMWPGQAWRPPLESVEESLKIMTPDERMVDAAGFLDSDDDQEPTLVYDMTDRPGVYRLTGWTQGESTARHAVAVNVDTAESDLERWSREELTRVFPSDRSEVISADVSLEGTTAGLSGHEVWWLGVGILAAMLLLETVLAHLFVGRKQSSEAPAPAGVAVSGGAA